MKKTIWLMCFITLCATVLLFANKHITVYKPIQQAVDSLVVLKSKNSLQVYANKKLLKTYSCGIGSNRNGKKQYQGDNRTPEVIKVFIIKTYISITQILWIENAAKRKA